MYTYQVISDRTSVPTMDDLEASFIERPASKGAGFEIAFTTGYGLDPRYDDAVGVRCRVIRTDDDGQTQECTGSVKQVSPHVRVGLDGAGWQ